MEEKGIHKDTRMDFRETFDKSLIERIGSRYSEAELLWNHIEAFTAGKPVGELLENFTDHGRRHISDVVHTCWKLIPSHVKDKLSESEVFYLYVAALYHDIAMHLDIPRLKTVIEVNNCYSSHSQTFGDKPWKAEWREYGLSLLACTDNDLVNIFGRSDLSEAELLDATDFNSEDTNLKRAAGEFVRRNHARMAFEFAYFGLPRFDSLELPLVTKNTEAELVGELARSHGYPIRSMIKHLRSSEDGMMPSLSPRIVYLMAVLRISDYIQIGPERANSKILLYKPLNNPVSDTEWKINDAVDGVSEHRQKLMFTINPKKVLSVKQYFRIKSFFDGLANEIDLSIACLLDEDGELFTLGHPFVFRRIESDIDHDRLKRQLRFLAVDSSLKVAGDDLVKLLIGPLYGFDNSVAVREMLQNSLDAVDVRKSSGYTSLRFFSSNFDIQIITDTKEGTMIINDSGIGMDKDTILTKYLTVGASTKIRGSNDKSSSDDLPLRGRFGVGVLAMFLIAEKVIVRTRMAGSSEPGYEIEIVHNNLDKTEIREMKDSLYGTQIELQLKPGVSKYSLKERWVTTSESKLSVVIDGTLEPAGGQYPGRKEIVRYPFRRFRAGRLLCDYFSPVGYGCNVSVNGISVEHYHPQRGSLHASMNLWDFGAEVKINLQRSKISDLDYYWRQIVGEEESRVLKALSFLVDSSIEWQIWLLLKECQSCFPGAAISIERDSASCSLSIWSFIHYNYIQWGKRDRVLSLIRSERGQLYLYVEPNNRSLKLGAKSEIYFMERLNPASKNEAHHYGKSKGFVEWCRSYTREDWEEIRKNLPDVQILRSPRVISRISVDATCKKSDSEALALGIEAKHIEYWREASLLDR